MATIHIGHAGFFLRHGEAGEFLLMAQAGMNLPPITLNCQHPLVMYFMESRTSLTRYESEILPQFRALWQNEREDLVRLDADLFIPLRTKGGLVGIFALGPKLSGLEFSPDDLWALGALATQMAAAIENALLFALEAGQRRQAETLQNVLSNLTSDLDLEQVLDNILSNLSTVLPYDSASVFLLNKDILLAVAGRGCPGADQAIGREFPLQEAEIFQEIQRVRTPLLVPDVAASPLLRRYLTSGEVRSWMGVPLIARGTVIGYLVMESRALGAYSRTDQADLAQAFASHASIAIENARLFRVEREQRQLAEALRDIGSVLSTTLDFDQVLDLLLDQVGRVVPYSVANIMLVENGRVRVVRTRFHESINPAVAQLLKTSTFSIAPAPNIYYLVDTALPLVVPSVSADADWITSPVPVRSWVGAPVVDKGRVIACFSLASLEPEYYQKRHSELLSVFAGQAALALQNARLFAEIQTLAMTDDLTNTFNRRHLFELGEREFSRAQRYNRPLSVVMLDLDDFKVVNDTHGHAVGDQVLRMVAERCRANIREVDILGRYGGEEFTIILPEAGITEAYNISERLRKHIAIMPMITTAGPVKLTISMGAAALTVDTPNLTKLIDCADIAMYEAKRGGRNAVCIYDEMHTGSSS
jgi:diguanylate cyclase (GGDEF)-like protein